MRNGQTLIVKESFPSVTKWKTEDDSVRIESQEAILTKIQLPEAVLFRSIKGEKVLNSDEGELKQVRYQLTYSLSNAKQLKSKKSIMPEPIWMIIMFNPFVKININSIVSKMM